MSFSAVSLNKANMASHPSAPTIVARYFIVRRGDSAVMEKINVLNDVLLIKDKGLAPHGRLGFNMWYLDIVVEETRALEASIITAASSSNALADCVVAIYTKIKEHNGRFLIKIICPSPEPLKEYWEELSMEKSYRLIAKCVVAAIAKNHGIPLSARLKQQQQQAANKVINHAFLAARLESLSLATTNKDADRDVTTTPTTVLVASFLSQHDSSTAIRDNSPVQRHEEYARAVMNHIEQQQPEPLLFQHQNCRESGHDNNDEDEDEDGDEEKGGSGAEEDDRLIANR